LNWEALCAFGGQAGECWRWTADGDYNDDDAYSGRRVEQAMIPALRTGRFGCRGHGKEQSKSEANLPPVSTNPHQPNSP
jgi:hypothetical protein